MNIKDKLIIKKMKGKSVLHIGVMGDFGRIGKNIKKWEFNRISKVAKTALGIDIHKEYVAQGKKLGYNVQIGNAETFRLKKNYEIIYAGDLIEHLSNPGLFLESCTKHMNTNSTLIITTPNPHSFGVLCRSIFNKVKPMYEHTMYVHKENMRELAQRTGLKIVKTTFYTEKTNAHPIRNLIYRTISKILPHLSEEQLFIIQRS
jgi:2-polyprenyl-3-methyl-5-hydroxy-6-metoxy-1,4-benzoquinol methylase